MRFGEIVRQMRVEKGMTQQMLADKVGASGSSRGSLVGMFERGERYPSGKSLGRICDIFGLNLDVMKGLIAEEKKHAYRPGKKAVEELIKSYDLSPSKLEDKMYMLFEKFWWGQDIKGERNLGYVKIEAYKMFFKAVLSAFSRIKNKMHHQLYSDLGNYVNLKPGKYNYPEDNIPFLVDFFLRLDNIMFGYIFGRDSLIPDEQSKLFEEDTMYHLVRGYKPDIEIILKGSTALEKIEKWIDAIDINILADKLDK
jgi:transcriptional regulator with XRE-family HTH domain